MNKYQSALREVPLFSEFSAQELKVLEKTSEILKFDKNQEIVHRDETGDTFFFILDGKVKVILTGNDDKEFIVDVLRTRDFFGELSLLDGEPRSATVVALQTTEVLCLRRDDFIDAIKKHPEICIKMMIDLSRRLRKSNQHIENLVFKDVCSRLAKMLMSQADATGISRDNSVFLQLEYSRTEMANLIGTTRETLTRALKTLQGMGFLKVKQKTILITNAEGLKQRI